MRALQHTQDDLYCAARKGINCVIITLGEKRDTSDKNLNLPQLYLLFKLDRIMSPWCLKIKIQYCRQYQELMNQQPVGQ